MRNEEQHVFMNKSSSRDGAGMRLSDLGQNTIDTHIGQTRIIFLTAVDERSYRHVLTHLGNVLVVRDRPSLDAAAGDVLLSFGTSVIVPHEILRRFPGGAYNIHAASPEYPGRDPHHWAIHDGVTRYGATLHVMTEKVDEGPIIDVEWFDVAPGMKPAELLCAANHAAFRIIERVGPRLQRGEVLPPKSGTQWSGKKRSRQDFMNMCRIEPDISAAEFERRFSAFDGGDYDNLNVIIQGWTFRIDKKIGRKV